MIYVPGRFLFVHIPRTGGTSITTALAPYAVAHAGIVSMSDQMWPWTKHQRAESLRHLIPDWKEIKKFAVQRDPNQIAESDWRLHQQCVKSGQADDPAVEACWREELQQSREEDLEQFAARRWTPIEIKPGGIWGHWCHGAIGTDALDVKPLQFENLREKWPAVCKWLGIDPVPALPHVNHA